MSELIHGEQILSSWLLVIHDSTNWKQINRRHINKQIASRGDTVNDYEIIGTEQNNPFNDQRHIDASIIYAPLNTKPDEGIRRLKY